jgi:predicted ATP-binding protein involved in virulence
MSDINQGESPTLLLESVRIKNFRCFEDCSFDLHPQITVFVADNGKGKTAILEAIRYSLESFVFAVAPSIDADFIDAAEMHRRFGIDGEVDIAKPTEIEVQATVNSESISWVRERRSAERRSGPNHQIKELRVAATSRNGVSNATDFVYPVLGLYRANRSAVVTSGVEVGIPLSERSDRLSGYVDCFDPIGSFHRFVKWYRAASINIREKSSLAGGSDLSVMLASVNDAVREALEPTQWNDLRWDYDQDQLVVANKYGHCLPASAMSDGVRNTLAIVADIAHRCCRLNPQFEDSARLRTSGVVLIDEIDLHLHPGWQQQIIGILKSVFPLVQFVLTTHSPQVLSTVSNDSIRVIRVERGIASITTPKFQTRGVESAAVLAEIMGIDPVPPVEEAVKLSRYRALIEDRLNQTDEGKSLVLELTEHFGSDHPLIKDCERLDRFFAFKDRKRGGES